MGSTTLTRRQLFSKIKENFHKKASDKDPLFEKYSRKVFDGRRYSSAVMPANGFETARVVAVSSGLAQYSGPWTDREALHLLRRATFGPSVSEITTLKNLSFNDALNRVLYVDPTRPSPPVNWYTNRDADGNMYDEDPIVPYGQDWTEDGSLGPNYDMRKNDLRLMGTDSWSMMRLFDGISIKEKMTMFLFHIMPIDSWKIASVFPEPIAMNSSRVCYRYLRLLRDNCNGNYKSLVRSVATAPAMMFYLNNQVNSKNAPDENFAREVMELFTIGKDVPNVYTQEDVVQAAKVLSGWRVIDINSNAEFTQFKPDLHDESNKQFSAFFDNTIIPSSGAAELDLFIDMIFTKSKLISEYICRRLYRFFVYYDIDANVEANVIVPLAELFVNSNWEIAPVIDKLFKSEHFFDMANRGVYIKSPFDFMVNFVKGLQHNQINLYNNSDPNLEGVNLTIFYTIMDGFLSPMGQEMGKVPNIAGWVPFYQNPSFHEFWINSDTIQRRHNFIQRFSYADQGLNSIQYVKQFPNAICQDPNLLVNECVKYLLPVDLSQEEKDLIKNQTLLSGQTADYYWSGAWTNYLNDPTNETKELIVRNRLQSLLLTILEYAEYLLM